VDLKESRNLGKSGDTRFLNRVFNDSERCLIGTATRPDAILWALWAAKEAAFKAVSKVHPAVSFQPRRYEVRMDDETTWGRVGDPGRETLELTGRVETPAGTIPIRVTLRDDYVLCIAGRNGPASEADHCQVETMDPLTAASPDGPSRYVRTSARQAIAACLGIIPEEISIHRFPAPGGLGPPVVFIQGRPAGIDISLSHDGRFAAWAFIRIN
jgi:phosphopantetheinyl transferase (holo-ACP synthase)